VCQQAFGVQLRGRHFGRDYQFDAPVIKHINDPSKATRLGAAVQWHVRHDTKKHGVKLAVDKRFDLHLDGTEIDFIDDLNRRGFKFNNPNSQKTCGCGSSFAM
jgi:hypothetical protein